MFTLGRCRRHPSNRRTCVRLFRACAWCTGRSRTRARAQRFGKTVLRKQSITLEDLELVVALALPPSGHRSAEKGRILVPQGHGPLLHVELHCARLPAAERKGRLARPRRHTRADSAPRRPVSLLRALAWAPRSRHNRPSQSRQSCARRGRPRPWWPHRATLPPCMRWHASRESCHPVVVGELGLGVTPIKIFRWPPSGSTRRRCSRRQGRPRPCWGRQSCNRLLTCVRAKRLFFPPLPAAQTCRPPKTENTSYN